MSTIFINSTQYVYAIKLGVTPMTDFNVILFDDFETLDAFGPAEIIGRTPNSYNLEFFSMEGGIVTSSQNVKVHTKPLSEMNQNGVLLIPGGFGTRALVNDDTFISRLKEVASAASYVLTVCTGSGLLAKTGLLDGHRATSNKRAFSWAESVSNSVMWINHARWVVAGCYYTSSGVSAGMDMALGFVADLHGADVAADVASGIEYIWNSDPNNDPFSI